MAAICGSDRSTGRLIDVAPRSSRTRAVAGFAAASVEEAHLYPLCPSQGDHPLDFLVGLKHHAAALADAMNRDGVLAGGRYHRFHRARSFARRDFDAILSAVVETLARGWQVVGVAVGQLQIVEDRVSGPHGHPRIVIL
jgi:hypothetical protein